MHQPQHDDDLFTPSLGEARPTPPQGSRPWRLSSQFYVSVFGGPVAAGLVGVLNGRRLGLPRARLAAIAGLALAALGASVVVVALLDSEENSPLRLVAMIAGAVIYLPTRELQQDADRRYSAARVDAESYDSLWLPGIGMALGGGLLWAIAASAATA